jgi:hypothetical protein
MQQQPKERQDDGDDWENGAIQHAMLKAVLSFASLSSITLKDWIAATGASCYSRTSPHFQQLSR